MAGPVSRHKDAGLAAYQANDLDGAVREWKAAVDADRAHPGAEGDLGKRAAYNLGIAASTRANTEMKRIAIAAPSSRATLRANAQRFLQTAADGFDYARRDTSGNLIAEPQSHIQYASVQADMTKVELDANDPAIRHVRFENGKLSIETAASARFTPALQGVEAAMKSAQVAPNKLDVSPKEFESVARVGFANLLTQTALHSTAVALGAIAAFGDTKTAPMMEGVRTALGVKTGADLRAKFPNVTARQWAQMWSDWAGALSADSPVAKGAKTTLMAGTALLVAERGQ